MNELQKHIEQELSSLERIRLASSYGNMEAYSRGELNGEIGMLRKLYTFILKIKSN